MKKSKAKWISTILFLLMFLLLSVSASAQAILISGRVVDAKTNVLIAGSKVSSASPTTLHIYYINPIGLFAATASNTGSHGVNVTVGGVTDKTYLNLCRCCLCQVTIKWDQINKQIYSVKSKCNNFLCP